MKPRGRVARALANTVSSERGRWILEPHFDSRAEWSIGGVVRDHLVAESLTAVSRCAGPPLDHRLQNERA